MSVFRVALSLSVCVVWVSQSTAVAVKIVLAHTVKVFLGTESVLWLADTGSKLLAARAWLEDPTDWSGELKLIWTASSVKWNSDSLYVMFLTTRLGDTECKCALQTVRQPAGIDFNSS